MTDCWMLVDGAKAASVATPNQYVIKITSLLFSQMFLTSIQNLLITNLLIKFFK